MEREALVQQLKEQIIKVLLLEDLTPDDIDPDAPLFVTGLGLDSIDAIELILLLDNEYGIKVEDPKERRNILRSVNTMADFILQHPS